MESIFSVGIANRYEAFIDDEMDPIEAIKLMEQKKQELKKKAKAEKENATQALAKPKAAPVPKKQAKTTPVDKQDNKKVVQKVNGNRSPTEDRSNRKNGLDNKTTNGTSDNHSNEKPRGYSPRANGNAAENHRGNSRPLGNKNGGRGERPRRNVEERPDRRNKREFDRQSGSDKTGVKPVEKRDGAGAHNWGSHKDLINEGQENDHSEVRVEEEGESPKPAETVKEESETTAPVEEDEKLLTLEEYKAKLALRAKPQYRTRRAGEGEDLTQWNNMVALNNKAKEGDDSDDEDFDLSMFPQRVGRQKHVKDIAFFFNDTKRSGAVRGGKGVRGGRKGRFREGDDERDEREKSNHRLPAPPKVDDERAFPSLG